MFSRCCLPFDTRDLHEPEPEIVRASMKQKELQPVKKKVVPVENQSPRAVSPRAVASRAAAPRVSGCFPRSKLRWNQDIPELKTRRRYAAAVVSEVGDVFVIGGYDGRSPLSNIEHLGLFENNTDAWAGITEMKAPNSGLAAAMVGETIFVVGGFHGSRRQASAASFNIKTKEWHELPKMHRRRGGCAAVVLNENVIVIGGNEGSMHLSSAEVFQNSSWTVLPAEMKERRFNCAATVIDGTIYVVGGENERGALTSVECYRDGKWTQLPPMRTARKSCALVAVQHCLVVAGGNDGSKYLSSCEMFDTKTQVWAALPSMQTERGRCTAVATRDSAYIIGGFDGMQCLSSLERLDLYHTLPTPPCLPEEPADLHESTQAIATAGWISQAHAVVDSFKGIIDGTTKQVHEDYAYKQHTIQKEIEALHEELNQAAADRDLFLNDLQKGTVPWFRYQRKRIAEVRERARTLDPTLKTELSHGVTPTLQDQSPIFNSTSSCDTPEELKCPITMEIMRNPVIAADGVTYERAAIERVFQSTPIGEPAISPKTKVPLSSRILIDNVNVRIMCRDYQVETREDNETERGVRSF